MKLLHPLHDWVLVRLDPEGAYPPSGLLASVRPRLVLTGRVVAAGPGRDFVDGVHRGTEVREGERVAFLAAVMDTQQGRQLRGATLGEDQALIRESDILFVIEEGNPRLDK